MPTFALFGATGNVGKELVKALKEKSTEDDFLIFSRKETTEDHQHARFKPTILPKTEQDSLDTNVLAEILKSNKVETCFLCIPQLQVHKAREYAAEIIPALTQAGVVRVVKVGTGNAELYEYGRCHVAAEEAIKDAGLKLTVVQGGDYSTNPHWLGPAPPGAPYILIDVFKGMSVLSKVGLGLFRSMGNIANFFGEAKEPFLHLQDFGQALAACLLDAQQHEGQVYKVYSDSVSMQQVANVYGTLLGRKLHVIDMSDNEIRELVAMDGIQGEMQDLLIDMMTQFKKGVYVADSSWDGLQKLCPGKEPRSFEDFAKENVEAKWKPIKLW